MAAVSVKRSIALSAGRKVSFEVTLRGGGCTREGSVSQANKNL